MRDRFKFRVWDEDYRRYHKDAECYRETGEFYPAIENCYCFGDFLKQPTRFIVEQCTGLEDKDGKLIYEGDIVCYDDTPYNGYATKKTGVVVYRKAEFCYKYSDCCGGLYQPLVPSDDFWQRKTEIVGNIHESEGKSE